MYSITEELPGDHRKGFWEEEGVEGESINNTQEQEEEEEKKQ